VTSDGDERMLAPDLLSSNRGSERALLSLMLTDEDAIHEALGLGLQPDHLNDPGHRALLRGIADDLKRGVSPDEATLYDRFCGECGMGKPWDSLMSLTICLEQVADTRALRGNLKAYVENVLEATRRRQVVESARRLLAMADSKRSTDALVEETQRAAIRADQTRAVEQDLPSMAQIAQQACDRAVAVASGEASDTIVPLGLLDLDKKFAARKGDYILVGARPSMGKTHFMLSIMEQIARKSGPVQFHSIEMRSRALGDRLFAHDATGPWATSVKTAQASSRAVMRRWGDLPIRVDTKGRSLGQVLSSLRVAKQKSGIIAAGIDYLQLMRLPRAGSREQEVATASRELAALASELDIVLFVLCQLNRQLEQRPVNDRRPRMSDLRESGQLEQDADGILFLFRDAAYNPNSKTPEVLEVGIAKQRNGRAPRTAFCRYVPGDGFVTN